MFLFWGVRYKIVMRFNLLDPVRLSVCLAFFLDHSEEFNCEVDLIF